MLDSGAASVLDNDFANGGSPFTAVLVSSPTHGTLTAFNPDGTFSYTRDGSISSDSFTYLANNGTDDSNIATVTINVIIRGSPLASDDSASVSQGGTIAVLDSGADSVLDNDLASGGSPFTAVLVSSPTHGTLTAFNPDGTFSYTHDGSISSDSFTYQANNGTDDSNIATVTIGVATRVSPIARDDSATVSQGGTITVLDSGAASVLDNDFAAGRSPFTAVLVSSPTHGALNTFNSDGTFSYTHDGSIFSDSFTYRANNGTDDSNVATVAIRVNAVNDTPIAVDDTYTTDENIRLTIAVPGVLANDIDDGTLMAVLDTTTSSGTLALRADGSFDYLPNPNFVGTDIFSYRARDDQGVLSTAATVTITVNAVNDPEEQAFDNAESAFQAVIDLGLDHPVAVKIDIAKKHFDTAQSNRDEGKKVKMVIKELRLSIMEVNKATEKGLDPGLDVLLIYSLNELIRLLQ